MEWIHGEYRLSDDKTLLDLPKVHALLTRTYWASDRPFEIMQRSIENSIALGLYKGAEQVGFCRAVTDHATFTWICDVVVEDQHRRGGLGKWMVRCLIDHPLLQTRRQVLATKDAHSLYERFGFQRSPDFLKRTIPADKEY
jgi:GNAT superfamily N-acetyltransferase